jgi:hypothetical protein
MCSIFTQENCYGHALCRLCPSGSVLSHRTARVAPSGDLDRVLPAMLSPPSHRLPLPGLRPGGAPSTTANTSPYTDHALPGDGERTTPALSQRSIRRRPTRRVGASRGPTRACPRPSLSASSESVSMDPTWFRRCVLPPTGGPCVPGRAWWMSLCVALCASPVLRTAMPLASVAGDRQHVACAGRKQGVKDNRDGACAAKESDAMRYNTPSHAHEAHRDRLGNATVRPQHAPLMPGAIRHEYRSTASTVHQRTGRR